MSYLPYCGTKPKSGCSVAISTAPPTAPVRREASGAVGVSRHATKNLGATTEGGAAGGAHGRARPPDRRRHPKNTIHVEGQRLYVPVTRKVSPETRTKRTGSNDSDGLKYHPKALDLSQTEFARR